ncbi:hypothetical protein TNCV_5038611 [Trichonephila clavipes]|nr:hypothetical protein TNCV_5038611 [Trichonephila clavipes]
MSRLLQSVSSLPTLEEHQGTTSMQGEQDQHHDTRTAWEIAIVVDDQDRQKRLQLVTSYSLGRPVLFPLQRHSQ